MNPKDTLLAALEEIQRHEEEVEEGALDACIVIYSVQGYDGDYRLGWALSDGPYYAHIGMLGEAQEGIRESSGEWVSIEDDDDEDD